MTTWKSNLSQMKPRIEKAVRSVESDFVDEAFNAIVYGSPLTGSPGQPEDLRDGQFEVEKRDGVSVIGSNDPSAQSVENGISRFNGHPITLKSSIGGFHSTSLTHQNAPRILEEVVRRRKNA